MTSWLSCLGGSAEPGSALFLELALGFQAGHNFTAAAPIAEKGCCFLPSPGTPCPGLAVDENGQPHVLNDSDLAAPHAQSWPPPPWRIWMGLSRGPVQAPGSVEEQGHSRQCPQHAQCPAVSQPLRAGPTGARPEVQGKCEPLMEEVELFSPTLTLLPTSSSWLNPLGFPGSQGKESKEWA